jgi:hypothetical protein
MRICGKGSWTGLQLYAGSRRGGGPRRAEMNQSLHAMTRAPGAQPPKQPESGAVPRGELLRLGFDISEPTVSRYLRV